MNLTSFPSNPYFCPLVISHRYAESFSKTCSNFPVIQSVWLSNIFVLEQYHKRNTFVQQQVICARVKVTMTHKQNILASVITLNLGKVKASYFKFKR